jgi:uncharacterized membrane protein YjdF
MKKLNNYYIEAGVCMVFLSLVYAWGVFYSEWGHVIITAGLLILLAILIPKKAIPWFFFLLFPLVVFLYSLGSENSFNLYDVVIGYDKLVHFVTELVLTLLAGHLLMPQIKETKSKPLLLFVLVVSVGITLGVFWEIIEWLLTFIVPPPLSYSVIDTATDLIADSIGALVAASLYGVTAAVCGKGDQVCWFLKSKS